MVSRAVFVIALLAACGQASAQVASRPRPRVDPLSAAVQGRVTAADSGAPLRRAEVRALTDGGFSRMTVTDAEGRYELRDMPAGRFRINVAKSGFVPLYYGQRRPFEASTTIALAEGQRVTANVALPRGAAIAGRVYDESGEPLAGVRVQALRARMSEGRRRLLPVGAADVTDDTGAYRVYGLPPGDYYVTATSPGGERPAIPAGGLAERLPPMTLSGDLFAMVRQSAARPTLPYFHPGTASFVDAHRIILDAGTEAGADILIGPARAPSVSGIVMDPSGVPVADASVTLRSEMVAMGISAIAGGPPPVSLTAHTDATGAFEIADVPPGPYTLHASGTARFQIARSPDGSMAALPMVAGSGFAILPLVVGDAGITGLMVRTGPGGTLEGRIVADPGVTQPLPAGLRVNMRTSSAGGPHLMTTSGNNTFRFDGVGGRVHVYVEGLPEGWAVKAITMAGTDVTDEPLDMTNGATIELSIALTDRVTEVAGTIADTAGAADASQTVVVFADDAARWTYPSRYLKTVRSDDQGGFRIIGLPPNERYLAVAVDFLEEGEGEDLEFLERFRDRATSFTLNDGERRAITLRPIRR